jgi:hypothetical protein
MAFLSQNQIYNGFQENKPNGLTKFVSLYPLMWSLNEA